MNGRHHLISGAATLVFTTSAAALFSGSRASSWAGGRTVGVVDAVSEFMTADVIPGFALGSIVTICLCIGLYFLGLLLPDVDSPTSMLGKVGSVRMGHRTWTHSIWPVLVLVLAGWFFRPLVWLAAGYFVHLFWDSMSRMGVCWFYPYPGYLEYGRAKVKKNHWLWLYHNGTIMETVVCWSSVVVALVPVAILLFTGSTGQML